MRAPALSWSWPAGGPWCGSSAGGTAPGPGPGGSSAHRLKSVPPFSEPCQHMVAHASACGYRRLSVGQLIYLTKQPNIVGERLTWEQLTGKGAQSAMT